MLTFSTVSFVVIVSVVVYLFLTLYRLQQAKKIVEAQNNVIEQAYATITTERALLREIYLRELLYQAVVSYRAAVRDTSVSGIGRYQGQYHAGIFLAISLLAELTDGVEHDYSDDYFATMPTLAECLREFGRDFEEMKFLTER